MLLLSHYLFLVTSQHFQKGFPLFFVAAELSLLRDSELLLVLLQEFPSSFDGEDLILHQYMKHFPCV
jgi:hypothetical protein